MKHGVFSIDLVFLLIIFLSILPYVFFKLRNKVPYPVSSSLKLQDFYILSTLLTYLIIGGYQQYFWTKDNMMRDPFTVPATYLDFIIKKNDSWVYIYNFIYYIMFGLLLVGVKNYKHFALIVIGGFILMSGLTVIWYTIPNVTHKRMETDNYFLSKTQKIDNNNNNACPSAHVVFAMYFYYLLRKLLGEFFALLIPIIVSISCLKTTQHMALDIVFAIFYSIIMYNFVLKKINSKVFI